MATLKHRVPVNASIAVVYAAVATQAGMRGWWTADTVMDERAGGKATFGFDQHKSVFRMDILEMAANARVVMTCQGDHPEWDGTTLTWVLEESEGGTVLVFTHEGWKDVTDFCASCNSMWGNLMYRLKTYAESGRPNPQWKA